MKKKEKRKPPTIDNRQARHKYTILDTFEAGLELKGSEVKSIRGGQVSLKEGYVLIKNGEIFLLGVHIAPFEKSGNHDQHEAIRNIRLLMHKKEIIKLDIKVSRESLTLFPTKMYFKGGKIKVQLGIGKGKKLFDKRESKKKQDIERNELRKYR